MILIICIALFVLGCNNHTDSEEMDFDYYNELQTKLIMAEDGDTIFFPNKKIQLNRSLWVDGLSNIVIKGHGIDKTILSFKDQIEGSEGLKIINSNNIALIDFTIEDSKGDLIKVENTNEIQFINIKAQWTGTPKESNGAYGLYPVNCANVLIDNCIAMGASAAGIYVGQSKEIVVKNSEA